MSIQFNSPYLKGESGEKAKLQNKYVLKSEPV